MKIGNITTTNSKGQLVIPASLRAQLGITDQVPLHLTIKGNVLHIVPIKDIITIADSDSSYQDILKKTKGTWKKEEGTSEKRDLELTASARRKKTW